MPLSHPQLVLIEPGNPFVTTFGLLELNLEAQEKKPEATKLILTYIVLSNPNKFRATEETCFIEEWNVQGRVEGGGPLGHAPPLRSPNFTLDIGLSQKKVPERRSIGRKTRVAPPPPRDF